MSFFSSLQESVTSGLAGLGLNTRRFSFPRQDSNDAPSSISGLTSSNALTDALNSSHTEFASDKSFHGYPKVVPSSNIAAMSNMHPLPNHQHLLRRQSSKCIDNLITARSTSFKHKNPVTDGFSSMNFFKRRPSWPEVDLTCNSEIQYTDGGYFESFAALAKILAKYRVSANALAERRLDAVCEIIKDNFSIEEFENDDVKDELYVEVLQTILNTTITPNQAFQNVHCKDELYFQAQRAFNIATDHHYHLLNLAQNEDIRKNVLSIIVQEAEDLEAKDLNGYSNPYCILSIRPDGNEAFPQQLIAPNSSSDSGLDNLTLDFANQRNLRKHYSFRLSFKRKEAVKKEDSECVLQTPAKLIKATSVKTHTLRPKWNETFIFDIEDINNDILQLDIWDFDDKNSTTECLKTPNLCMQGVSSSFKQTRHSCRQGTYDEYLGSVNIQACDIPPSGLDGWFKVETKTARHLIQGRIRLKVWLSKPGDSRVEEDYNLKIKRLEQFNRIFMANQLLKHEPTWTWNGDLPGPTLVILHQIAVQYEANELQQVMARLIAAIKIHQSLSLDQKFIYRQLTEIDKLWVQNSRTISQEQELSFASAMRIFVEKSLSQIERHREFFPVSKPSSLVRLEFLLRNLGLISSMRAYRQVLPFSKGVRGEIVASLRKGSLHWAKKQLEEAQKTLNPIVHLTFALMADVQIGQSNYHSIFDITNGIQYFSIIYKQFDSFLAEETLASIKAGQLPDISINSYVAPLGNDKEIFDTRSFEIYLALQEFSLHKNNLSVMPRPPEQPLELEHYYKWFEISIQRWLAETKYKLTRRVTIAVQMDKKCEGFKIVHHSTSAIDVVLCFDQFREFWKLLKWPDLNYAANVEYQIIESICIAAIQYSELMQKTLQDIGPFEQAGNFRTSNDMYIATNNIEYVRQILEGYEIQQSGSANPLDSTLMQLEMKIEKILVKINLSLQAPLHKAIFHLAWSPDSLPANQAIIPLFEYLAVHLSALNEALLSKIFKKALIFTWNAVLEELSFQIDTGNDSERPKHFHERLHTALELLSNFFNAGDRGLSLDMLQTELFWSVDKRLKYHKTETESLIDLFYIQRLQKQCTISGPSAYGVLAVRAYLNHDSLCVEILHARGVIPLDPNGFSDPFVIVELLPRRIFNHCNAQQTNVQKKTLNPIFDECFEFPIKREQCKNIAAMIMFTVMDHDVLTTNDFAGEAFLGLNNIPGVADQSASVENFHGLKQIDLPLMQQSQKTHPILQILETRVTDKNAMDFVRKQRARMET